MTLDHPAVRRAVVVVPLASCLPLLVCAAGLMDWPHAVRQVILSVPLTALAYVVGYILSRRGRGEGDEVD